MGSNLKWSPASFSIAGTIKKSHKEGNVTVIDKMTPLYVNVEFNNNEEDYTKSLRCKINQFPKDGQEITFDIDELNKALDKE